MLLQESFRVLGLKGTESIDLVKQRYHSLLHKHFPKTGGDDTKAREIIEAFKKLAEHFGEKFEFPPKNPSTPDFDYNSILSKLDKAKKDIEGIQETIENASKKLESKDLADKAVEIISGLIKKEKIVYGPLNYHSDTFRFRFENKSRYADGDPLVVIITCSIDRIFPTSYSTAQQPIDYKATVLRGDKGEFTLNKSRTSGILDQIPTDSFPVKSESLTEGVFNMHSDHVLYRMLYGRGINISQFHLASDYCARSGLPFMFLGEVEQYYTNWLKLVQTSASIPNGIISISRQNNSTGNIDRLVKLIATGFPEVEVNDRGITLFKRRVNGLSNPEWVKTVESIVQAGEMCRELRVLDDKKEDLTRKLKKVNSETQLFEDIFTDAPRLLENDK